MIIIKFDVRYTLLHLFIYDIRNKQICQNDGFYIFYFMITEFFFWKN